VGGLANVVTAFRLPPGEAWRAGAAGRPGLAPYFNKFNLLPWETRPAFKSPHSGLAGRSGVRSRPGLRRAGCDPAAPFMKSLCPDRPAPRRPSGARRGDASPSPWAMRRLMALAQDRQWYVAASLPRRTLGEIAARHAFAHMLSK